MRDKAMFEKIITKSVVNRGNVLGIANAMQKAKNSGEAVLGFIGGPITQGSSARRMDDTYVSLVTQWWKNTEELKIELDELIKESGVKPYLHTYYVANYMEEELKAIIIENKSGRQAIKAKVFIDASGDGDLCSSLGIPAYTMKNIQPPTTCAKIYGLNNLGSFNLGNAIGDHRAEFNIRLPVHAYPDRYSHLVEHLFMI